MGKLYAERLIKTGEDESMIPNETFVLRFKKLEIDSLKIKPPFKLLLHQEEPVRDVAPLQDNIAEEGVFVATQASPGDTISGVYLEEEITPYKKEDFEFRAYFSNDEEVTSFPKDELADITAAGFGNTPLTAATDITFSASTVNKTPGALEGITWSIIDAKGADAMTDAAAQSTGKDTITLNFPTSSSDEVQQYTIRVTTLSGQVKEKKVLIGLSDAQLTSVPVADKVGISRPKEIKIDKGIHTGTTVGMAPVTFSVVSWKGKKAEHNKNTDQVSWVVYKGSNCDNPILLRQGIGTTCTIDFTSLPEGAYRVEAFAQYSEWHVKKGINIYGETFSPVKGEVFKGLNVVSAKNAVESIKTDALITAKNKKQQTNWGVPVRFNADLLFDDVTADLSMLQWELQDAQGQIVMQEQTDEAMGKSSVEFNFPQPEKASDYTLKLTLNGASQTKKFTVVPKAYVKTIALETSISNRRVVNDEDKNITFKVTGYTQKQANATDAANVKWVRIFFPGLKAKDYSDSIKLTFVGDYPTGAYMNGQTGYIEHFSGMDVLTLEAGLEDPTLKKDAYWKGLYVVEAYTGKPDGKSTSEFHDMEYYEIIHNEPASIVQVKTDSNLSTRELATHGFMRTYGTNSEEYFTFKVNNWLFQQANVDSKSVRWGLFKNEADVTPEVTFLSQGKTVQIRTGKAGNYFLKAWVDDVLLAATLPITIEDARIINSFFADSSGKRISKCGIGDTVYVYFETTGLAQEEVQVNIFEEDSLGDDLLKAILAKPNDTGIIFEEIVLTKALLAAGELEEHFGLYLTMSMSSGDNARIRMPANESFDREQRHYYLNDSMILDVSDETKAVDYNFVDPGDNLVLNTPVLYGSKAKVRVRLTNQIGKEVYIHLFDVSTSKVVALPESKLL